MTTVHADSKSVTSKTQQDRNRTGRMVQLGLMIAIIFVMAFSPLGYLRTPGLTITFLTVPVAVGAILLGPAAGAVCGLAFGATSLILAVTGGSAFSAMLLSINPLGLAFTCLVPRVLEGWLCGLIFAVMKKRWKNAAYLAASLACPLLNTLLFMSSLVLIFYDTDYVQGLAASLGAANPLIFVVLFVGLQGVIEAGVCAVIGSIVSRTLAVALRR
ncbi:MAG: ECF transporter S component [Eubacteriales bacterium]|nr:ECF transporter S component [Eubacteriales bacterium]